MTRNAKVVCTLGPSSDDPDTIRALADAGMSVARLNASHGTPAKRRELIETLRTVDGDTAGPVATLLDLPGPEVRTADVDEPLVLEDGATVELAPGETATPERVGLSDSIAAVPPESDVLLDDGRIEAVVTGVADDVVTVRIESGGRLDGRTGVNVPQVDLGLPTVTERDLAELDVAAEGDVDFVAASFVRTAEDIYEIRGEMEERGVEVPIVAKIERAAAVENIDGIVEAAYGVMVARGDLGVECPLEDVPIIQKRLIRKCNTAGVPVITATEMLDSMVHSRRPTRAEASDVANAVLDGTDAVMLSGETAIGDHPVTVVETMCEIIDDAEGSPEYEEILEQRVPPADDSKTGALARSARFLSRDVDATAIVAASESGYTARKAAKYRPTIPVVAATPDEAVRRQLALSWGIVPKHVPHRGESADAVIQSAIRAALETEAAESGDTVTVLSGMMTELDGMDTANMLKVHVASETLASGRSVVPGYAVGPVHPVGDGDLSAVPDGVVLAVPKSFDGEFTGELSKIAGIVDEHEGVTCYAAIVARELEVPMIGGVSLPDVETGTAVTVDGERGVVYRDPLTTQER